MHRKILLALSFVFATFSVAPHTYAAIKAGTPCTKAGKIEEFGGKKFTCVKSGKKFIWNKGIPTTKSATPITTVSPSSTPISAPVFQLTPREEFANIDLCKIKSTLSGEESVGFPRSSTSIPSIGTVRGVTLFVEFTDLKDDGNPLRVWKTQQKPTAENYFRIASYGKLDYKVDLVEKVYPINKSVLTYNLDTPHDAPAKPNAKPFELVTDAMAAADVDVDFSKYDFVNVVTAATTLIGFEGATGLRSTFDGKLIQKATFGPIREYIDSKPKYNWLVHESGHLLGLMHPYSYQNSGFVIPTWDLMGDAPTPNSELLAWNKFLLGWLDSNQINCLDSGKKLKSIQLIAPISENAEGVKASIIRISDTKALVLENRRKSSLNPLSEGQSGIIAYVVDGTISPGKGAVSFLYAKLTKTFDDRLLGSLKPGESVKFQNVEIKVLSSESSGDLVSVDIS